MNRRAAPVLLAVVAAVIAALALACALVTTEESRVERREPAARPSASAAHRVPAPRVATPPAVNPTPPSTEPPPALEPTPAEAARRSPFGPATAGVDWLARHAGEWLGDGVAATCSERCDGAVPPGHEVVVTSFALLAFHGVGYHAKGKRHGPVVARALAALLARQDDLGRIGRTPVDHAVATLALSEAFCLTNAPELRAPLERALLRLSPRPGEAGRGCADAEWFGVMALISAHIAAVEPPAAALGPARAWVLQGTAAWSGGRHDDPARWLVLDNVLDRPEGEAGSPSRVARAERRRAAAAAILEREPLPGRLDALGWYAGSLGLHRDGPDWRRWKQSVEAAVLPAQARSGCVAGSWDPALDPRGATLGRPGVTAVLSLVMATRERRERVWLDQPLPEADD